MPKISIYLILFVFSLSLSATAQQKNIIPFQLTNYNNLIIKAVLNKKDTLQLMFHTAANALTLTEDAIKKIKDLKFDRIDSVKSWGGADNTSRYSSKNTLQIGNMQWDNLPLWDDKNSGPYSDGKFGPNLFENKVLDIDFDQKTMTITDVLPAKVKQYEKLNLSFENDMMFVTAEAHLGNSSFKNKYLLHSGYAGAVLFDDQAVSQHQMGQQLTITDEKQLKDSFGNVLKTKKAILPSFTLGKQKLDKVSIGFFEGALGRQKMSIIGSDVLKRFNIIIDAKREFIYIKANKLKKVAYANV